MQAAAEMELPFLAINDDGFAEEPFVHVAAAREKHPWLAKSPLGYVLTDVKAMRDFFQHEEKMHMPYDQLARIMDAEGTPWGEFQKRHMLAMTGAQHKRVRDLLAPSFTPRQANNHRNLMRAVIVDLLDEWAPKQSFDFEEFASYFPVTVMCRLIGASPAVIPSLRSAMEAIGLSISMDPRWLPAMQEGVVTMENFVDGLIAERRASGRKGEPDLLDMLMQIETSGELSYRELADLLIFLFVAGYDTSKNMLTLTMYELLSRPEMYRRCAESHDYAGKVIDESFRFQSITSTSRMLDEDVEYRGIRLEKNAIVWFLLNYGTRDGRYVEDADSFNPERERTPPPIGFGLGPHICLGQYIARAQIHEGLHVIAQRLRNPRSPGPQGWRPFPGAWGIRGLPVTFDTGAQQ